MLAYPAIPSIYPYYDVEQQFVKWDFVIKVKHGDTLRRLGCHVDGKLMDYTINKLRNKIISLFKFNDDADLILTYIDIDGDIVTLDNDDELRDAVIGQRLNPIRISVHLKSKPDTSSCAASLPSKTSPVAPVPNSVSDTKKPAFANTVNFVDIAQPFLGSADLSNSNQTKPISGSTSTKPSVVPANPKNRNIAYESIWSHFPTLSTNEKIDSVTKQNDSTSTGGYAFGFPKPTPADLSKSTSNEAPKVSFEQINQHPPQHSDLRGFHTNDLGMPNTMHKDVQRDIWGPYPIVGPSIMSIPKEAQGTEYAKHWPTLSVPTQFENGCHNEYKQWHQQRSNLDSVFVKDMTVLDGTVMPPSTPFIKTWKMRNNGTANWPYGTQLVWDGGHQLCHKSSFTLEQIPARGLPVGVEFDVIVGFTAPSVPGRYVSYWRLQCPSLRKFGQRVWVDFEVKDISCSNSSSSNFNLNLPPKNNTQSTVKENAGIDINADPVSEVGSTEATKKNTSNNELSDTTGDNEGVVKYDSVDPTLVADALAHVNDNCKVRYENSIEEDCLNELEDMGFKQVELNREVLRRNKFDLDLTIDDLCGFGQWDSLLSELHNMDFCDRELNKKMLVKNGGSFKRTVLDLLAENKD